MGVDQAKTIIRELYFSGPEKENKIFFGIRQRKL
jgi:hypothetical protein